MTLQHHGVKRFLNKTHQTPFTAKLQSSWRYSNFSCQDFKGQRPSIFTIWYNVIVLMCGKLISEGGNNTKYHCLLANIQGFVSNYSFTITKWTELQREHLVSWNDVRFTEFYFRSSCCSITLLLSLQSWRQSELSSAESLRSLQKSFVHSFLVHRHCVRYLEVFKLLNKIIEHVRCLLLSIDLTVH